MSKKTNTLQSATEERMDLRLREAIRRQARDLEKHLADIDKRLRALEERTGRR